MIIDCHGHYTTAPAQHDGFRKEQVARLDDPSLPAPVYKEISDDEIRESVEANQLKLQKERGGDLTIFSPRASAMAHHIGDEATSSEWTRHCNNLIGRVVELFPDNFIGVCQLPQSPGAPIAESTSPESEPSHMRVAGVVVSDSAIPSVSGNRSPSSPRLRLCSRSRWPSAWSRAHW